MKNNGQLVTLPPVAKEWDYMRAIATACPPETWGDIISKQVELAVAGNTKSAAFLAQFLLKNPPALSDNMVQKGRGDTIDEMLEGMNNDGF